jgi:hypothetical protein
LADTQGITRKGWNAFIFSDASDLLGWVDIDWQITARQYEARYDANEVAADNDFKGKRLLLSGTTDSIEKDSFDSSFLMLRASGISVRTALTEQSAIKAASFTKGQHIDLICKGSGRVVTIATTDDCELCKYPPAEPGALRCEPLKAA